MKKKREKKVRIAWWVAISLGLTRSAPLGRASPSYYSVGLCLLAPAFWRARPRAKMGGLAQWTPLTTTRPNVQVQSTPKMIMNYHD